MPDPARLQIEVPDKGTVTGRLIQPEGAKAIYVLAHGAGAGMDHPFMEAVAAGLAAQKIGTLRFNFPYTEAGKKSPDRQPVCTATIRAAVAAAHKAAPKKPLIAGGKSMGGRMTSLAQSEEALPHVKGLAFLGFPLHAVGKDSDARGQHLLDVDVPLLFLSGTRDKMANADLLTGLIDRIQSPTTLHWVNDGDHGFHVRKSSGRDDEAAMREICETLANWILEVCS